MRIVSVRWSLAAVLIAALLIRVAVLVGGWGSLAADDDAYGRLAVAWATTGTYGFPMPAAESVDGAALSSADSLAMRPTAYRPPLYPWLLSWFVDHGHMNLISVAVAHLWLGLASVGLTFGIASRLRIRCPALPALAVACDPILLRGSQLVMTETPITFLALAIWGLWLRIVVCSTAPDSVAVDPKPGRYALLGLLLGLSVLTRPTMLPWAVCLIGLCALPTQLFFRGTSTDAARGLPVLSLKNAAGCCHWLGLRVGMRHAVVVASVLLATLLPWMVRNARLLGAPIWTTTHGGYTLLLANNPSLYAHFRARGPSRDWDASDFHRHWAARRDGDPREAEFWQTPLADQPLEPPIEELADDRLAQQAAKATIARQPAMFALSCLYRIGWFWALAPHEASQSVRLAIGSWYALWFLCALWGLVRIGRAWLTPAWLAPAALVFTLTLVHAVYWSNMRMRAPLMPIVYVIAAVPLCMLKPPRPRIAV